MRVVAALWIAISLALGACGRIGFDPLVDPTGGGDDGSTPGARTVFFVNSRNLVRSELYTLDVTTGEAVSLGTLPNNVGDIVGLAYWDSTTLYATTYDGVLMKITLGASTTTQPLQFGLGLYGALERNGPYLLAIDDQSNLVVTIDPMTLTPIDGAQLFDVGVSGTIDADGGDLVFDGNAWFYWSNITFSLYTLDPANGNAQRVIDGSVLAPYLVGLVFVGGRLYGVERDLDVIYKLDPVMGTIDLMPTPVCLGCPNVLDVEFGDLTAGAFGL